MLLKTKSSRLLHVKAHYAGFNWSSSISGGTIKTTCRRFDSSYDLGSQYCVHDYQKLLKQLKMKVSMLRKGNCYENAPMENCWASLKNELVYHCRYETRDEAKASIQEDIECFQTAKTTFPTRLCGTGNFAMNYNQQQGACIRGVYC